MLIASISKLINQSHEQISGRSNVLSVQRIYSNCNDLAHFC